jgi:hypothetical protein
MRLAMAAVAGWTSLLQRLHWPQQQRYSPHWSCVCRTQTASCRRTVLLSGLLRPYRSDLVKKSSVVLYLNPPFISHAGAKLSLSITRLLKRTVVSQQRAKLVACGVEREN